MHAVLPVPASIGQPPVGPTRVQPQALRPAEHLAIRRALRASRVQLRPLALTLHLPFCANACHFCTRCRVIAKDRSKAQDYMRLLGKEMETLSRQLDRRQTVAQLHLGGGTTTFAGHQALVQMMQNLQRYFDLSDLPGIDASVAIDPREVDWATLDLLRGLGFNRLIIMQPSLDPTVQRAINRLQGDQQLAECMTAARTLRFHSIGIETMLGLPEQSLDSFRQTLEALTAWRPERIRLTPYQHQPQQYPLQQRINRSRLPTHDDIQAAQTWLQHHLSRAGYRKLQPGLFVLPEDPLAIAAEDNKLPTASDRSSGWLACDNIGLGLGATSQVNGLTWHNTRHLTDWQQRIARGQFAAEYQQP